MAGNWRPFPQGLDDPDALINKLPETTKESINAGEALVIDVYWTSVGNDAEPSMVKLRVYPKREELARFPATTPTSITLKLPNKQVGLSSFPAASGYPRVSFYTKTTEYEDYRLRLRID